MSSIGINVGREGQHPPELIRGLGATWIRIVATPEHDLTDYLRACKQTGLSILLVLARESGGDYAGYRDRYGPLVDAVQVGNEADQVGVSSWTMSQVDLAALGRSVRAIFPDTPLVCAGLASGQPGWLDGMDLSWCDALGVHGYLKDAPSDADLEDLTDLPALLDGYRRFGKPLLVTEWGWWSDDEQRGREEVADMVAWAGRTDRLEALFYFCLGDDMVPPFGLLRADGSEKPAAKAFREQAPLAIHSLWPGVAPAPLPPVVRPPTDLRAYARAAAGRAGIPPDLFERQIQQESGFDPHAFNRTSGATGIAQIIPRFHPDVDPSDPLASLDYAAGWMGRLWRQYRSYRRALAAYNWGPGNVAGWDGGRATLPAETRRYLDVILGEGWPEPALPGEAPPAPGRVAYHRDEPAHPQEETFDCSQESLEWALWAYGRRTTDTWLESTMLAEGVMSAQLGLLDASGAGLAAFIRRHYAELGYDANHSDPVSFDDLAAEFRAPGNPYPGLIGGRRWNHWSGLRAYDPAADRLLLANPADGHMGIRQTMDRAQFRNLGPFSLVRVIHRDVLGPTPAPPPPVADPRRERIRALRSEIEARVAELAGLVAG